MKYLNSQTLGAAGWISVFGLSWLMLLGIVPITGLSIVLFMFYLATGLFASAYHAAEMHKKSKNSIRELHELYGGLLGATDVMTNKESKSEEEK